MVWDGVVPGANSVDAGGFIEAVHAANVLALWPDTVCAGDSKTRLVIRGGFPAGAVMGPGGVAVSPSGDNAAPPPRVMGFEPGEEGLEPRVIEEDPTLATMWRSIELYLDIPEDALGLYDVTVACGGVQGYVMEKVLSVVTFEPVGGYTWTHASPGDIYGGKPVRIGGKWYYCTELMDDAHPNYVTVKYQAAEWDGKPAVEPDRIVHVASGKECGKLDPVHFIEMAIILSELLTEYYGVPFVFTPDFVLECLAEDYGLTGDELLSGKYWDTPGITQAGKHGLQAWKGNTRLGTLEFTAMKIEFIRQDNTPFPKGGNDACHMVSKFKTDENLPDTATEWEGPPVHETPHPDFAHADPDTFRVQVAGIPAAWTPQIRLDLVRGGQTRADANVPHTYSMIEDKIGGQPAYRTDEHVRLVSNDTDDAHLAHQTVKVQLEDRIRATLLLDDKEAGSIELPVGRPVTDPGTNINAVRTVDCHFVLVDYEDVLAKADEDTTVRRMTEAWAQCSVRFSYFIPFVVNAVRNVIRIQGTATGPGEFSVTVDGFAVPKFPYAAAGRRTPHLIAQDIAAGINAALPGAPAFAYNTLPGVDPTLQVAHVVVKPGQSVKFLPSPRGTAPDCDISAPQFSIKDLAVDHDDEEPCLAANYGDGDPNTIDIFIVKTLTTGNIADAWPAAYCGDTSDARNTTFVKLSAADGSVNNPHTAAHEAGRCLLNTKAVTGFPEYNLMRLRIVAEPDSISANKRLTGEQHRTCRRISEGTLLKQK